MQQKRRRPSSADHELASALNSALIHALRAASRSDQDAGAGKAGLSALSVLVFGGDQRLGDLARIELVSKATMSRVVDVLERRGLVRRAADPADRRAVWVRVTPAGRTLLLDARARRIDFVVKRLTELTHAEADVLRAAVPLLERMATTAN